jgi:hypothetical protein
MLNVMCATGRKVRSELAGIDNEDRVIREGGRVGDESLGEGGSRVRRHFRFEAK